MLHGATPLLQAPRIPTSSSPWVCSLFPFGWVQALQPSHTAAGVWSPSLGIAAGGARPSTPRLPSQFLSSSNDVCDVCTVLSLFSPLQIMSNLCNLWGDTLRACPYPAPHQTHTHTSDMSPDAHISHIHTHILQHPLMSRLKPIFTMMTAI